MPLLSRDVLRAARTRRLSILLYMSIFTTICYLLSPTIWDASVRLVHLNPYLYEHSVENYNFSSTPSEESCLAGSNDTSTDPIPKVVHFIWGLKEGKGQHARFGFMEYLSIRAALIALKPEKVIIHYATLDESGEWFSRIKPNITLVHHHPSNDSVLRNAQSWQAAHKADVLRLDILRREGGIYLDLDVVALRPFDAILSSPRDAILGHEGGNRAGMANAVIVARKDSSFIKRWIKTYDSFSTREWNYHSVILPKKMAGEFPDEICGLSPTAFFWPTWTYKHIEYMHAELTKEEAEQVKEEVRRNEGALVEGQLAYHAWSQMAWGKYLRYLDEARVREVDTRFNIMMRRFL